MSLKKIVRVPHESQLSGTAKTNSEKKTFKKKEEKGYTLTRALWDTVLKRKEYLLLGETGCINLFLYQRFANC